MLKCSTTFFLPPWILLDSLPKCRENEISDNGTRNAPNGLYARRAVEEAKGQYLDGGERRLVEALEVAAHLPLPQKLPPPLLQRCRPGIPRRRSSLEE